MKTEKPKKLKTEKPKKLIRWYISVRSGQY